MNLSNNTLVLVADGRKMLFLKLWKQKILRTDSFYMDMNYYRDVSFYRVVKVNMDVSMRM